MWLLGTAGHTGTNTVANALDNDGVNPIANANARCQDNNGRCHSNNVMQSCLIRVCWFVCCSVPGDSPATTTKTPTTTTTSTTGNGVITTTTKSSDGTVTPDQNLFLFTLHIYITYMAHRLSVVRPTIAQWHPRQPSHQTATLLSWVVQLKSQVVVIRWMWRLLRLWNKLFLCQLLQMFVVFFQKKEFFNKLILFIYYVLVWRKCCFTINCLWHKNNFKSNWNCKIFQF